MAVLLAGCFPPSQPDAAWGGLSTRPPQAGSAPGNSGAIDRPPDSATTEPSPMPSVQINQPARLPERLAFYYGWPSAAVFEGGVSGPLVDQFSQFSAVVLGSGLADPRHPDHAFATDMIRSLRERNVDVYGYMDMGITTRPMPVTSAQLETEMTRWQGMGVTGIFWDDVGYEFAGDLSYAAYRSRQLDLIEQTHQADLSVFLNVWDPDDLLREEWAGQRLATPRLSPDDILLAEAWFVSEDQFVSPGEWYRKAQKLNAYRQRQPFRLACVATGPDHANVEESDKFQAAFWAATMMGCDLFQYTNPYYSASGSVEGNRLYVPVLPQVDLDDVHTGDITIHVVDSLVEFSRPVAPGIIVVASDGRQQGYGLFRWDEMAP